MNLWIKFHSSAVGHDLLCLVVFSATNIVPVSKHDLCNTILYGTILIFCMLYPILFFEVQNYSFLWHCNNCMEHNQQMWTPYNNMEETENN